MKMKAAIKTTFVSLLVLGLDAKKGREKCQQLYNLKIMTDVLTFNFPCSNGQIRQ